jgi:hypothetical protein
MRKVLLLLVGLLWSGCVLGQVTLEGPSSICPPSVGRVDQYTATIVWNCIPSLEDPTYEGPMGWVVVGGQVVQYGFPTIGIVWDMNAPYRSVSYYAQPCNGYSSSETIEVVLYGPDPYLPSLPSCAFVGSPISLPNVSSVAWYTSASGGSPIVNGLVQPPSGVTTTYWAAKVLDQPGVGSCENPARMTHR